MASLTVLGGGNTAFAVAANLSLAGHQVTLCELPAFASMIDPIRDSQQIKLEGVAGRGVATLHRVTTSFSEALGNELLLVIVPAYAHRAFAEAMEPHLRPNHDIVLMPGTLGSLEFARIFRDKGDAPEGVVIAEADTAPYVCRKTTPTSATIWGVVSGLGVGVFPATETERVRKRLDPLFPGIVAHPHVAACGLAAMNPVVHPAGVLLNAGRIEQSRGEFYFYDEGVTPAVCRLIYGVDAERRALGQVLGIDLLPVDAAFHRAGFGPQGDLWSAINGSRMLTQLKAPGSLETRWLSEDVPYGIASWALLGEQFGLRMPLMRALVDLTSATVGVDFWKAARTPKDLGIATMSCDALLKYVLSGAL